MAIRWIEAVACVDFVEAAFVDVSISLSEVGDGQSHYQQTIVSSSSGWNFSLIHESSNPKIAGSNFTEAIDPERTLLYSCFPGVYSKIY